MDGPDAKREFDGVMLVLGALFAAPAIISLIQHVAQVGLHWYFADFVDFYRALATPVIDLIQLPIRWLLAALGVDWTIPRWVKDLHTLSFVGAGIFTRGLASTDNDRSVSDGIGYLIVGAFLGFIGVGLLCFLIVGQIMLFERKSSRTDKYRGLERVEREGRAMVLVTQATALAVVVFYAGNTVAPMLGQ